MFVTALVENFTPQFTEPFLKIYLPTAPHPMLYLDCSTLCKSVCVSTATTMLHSASPNALMPWQPPHNWNPSPRPSRPSHQSPTLTCMGNHNEANAATTITTSRVTRFLPFFDSAERPPTELRHSRDNIHMYRTLISMSGTTYELRKNAMWKAAQEELSFSRKPHVSISRSWYLNFWNGNRKGWNDG